VGNYRPTGTGWKAGRPEARPAAGGIARPVPTSRTRRPLEPRSSVGERPLPAPRGLGEIRSRRQRGGARDEDLPVPDTGEPRIVQKVRGQFASWAAVSLGCFGINLATGIDHPWFLFPLFGMGIGLLRNYAQLWQAGYNWRDVVSRPAAPDAIETTMARGIKGGRQLAAPRGEEFGAHFGAVQQVFGDRQAILKLMERLPASERKMLPEVQQTADALYNRATDLARTLQAMDSNFDAQGLSKIDERISALSREADDTERARRLNLLERQRQTIIDLQGRRTQVASHLESCVLAMQNMRFDLLRLRSAGVAAVLGDLTQATQQAKALSRDVDNAIAAASEIREAMRQ